MAGSSNLLLKIGLVLGAGYLGMKAYEKKLLPIGPSTPTGPTTPSDPKPKPTTKPVKTSVPLSEFPLKKSSKGEYVKTLQVHLRVTADGIFGPMTEAALLNRYGKKQVTTLAELNTMVSTGASIPAKPGTAPTLPDPNTTPTTAASDYQKKLTAQMWTVFNAIWSKTGGSTIYTQLLFGKWEAILPVLSSMSDAELKGFINAYGRSFKGLSFPKSVARTGTLLGDLQRISKTRANVAYFAQVDRVKKLS